jgi:hypothetical protein
LPMGQYAQGMSVEARGGTDGWTGRGLDSIGAADAVHGEVSLQEC